MRLFTALQLPESVRIELAHIQARLKSNFAEAATWTSSDNLHLTLKFLGEVPEVSLPDLRQALGKVTGEPFVLKVQGLGTLPAREPARVITAEVSGQTEVMKDLFDKIEQVTESLGFAREVRDFHPHITLARLRSPHPVTRELEAVSFCPLDFFPVTRFVLLRSTLGATVPSYWPVAHFKLN